MLAASIPAVIGEGLKPLKASHTPSENSQAATGITGRPAQPGQGGVLPEQRGEHGDDEQGASDESQRGNDPGHQPGPVHQRAQQQRVDARHEGLAEQERPLVDRDVRRAGGDQRGRIGSGRSAQVLPQGHQRQQADDTGEDHGGFQDAGGDKPEREAFVLPLDHRVQRDGGADAGQRHDHLQEAAHQHAGAGAGAEDPVPVVQHRAVDGEGGDRDEGDQVEHTRD